MQTTTKNARILSFSLWTAQILLSACLLWGSFTKLFTPAESLAEIWPWTAGNHLLVIVTGIVDFIAGAGILLPSLFKVKTRLVTFAAVGIIVLMLAACIFHIARGEASQIGINVILAALAGFVIRERKKIS